MTNPHILKKLQVKKNDVKKSIKEVERKVDETTASLNTYKYVHKQLIEKKNKIDNEYKPMTSEPSVSEHSMLRWLERVRGIDLEEVRRDILTDRVIEQIKVTTTCKIPVEKCTLIVRDCVVVTCETRG